MAKKEPDPWFGLPASERMFRKIHVLGENALLEYDEIEVLLNVGATSVRSILEAIPCAQALPQVKRWRYGTILEYMRRLEELSAA